MARTRYINVEIGIDEFDDDDIIKEFKDRKLHLEVDGEPAWLVSARQALERGQIEDGLTYLERALPGFRGLLVRNLVK